MIYKFILLYKHVLHNDKSNQIIFNKKNIQDVKMKL